MFASYAGVGALSTIKKWGEDWWKTFNNQLLIGPLTMLMLYLSMRLMSSDVFSLLTTASSNNSLTQGIGNTGNTAEDVRLLQVRLLLY